MATAIDTFLKQVTLTGGIPFVVALPKAPANMNADMMSVLQIRDALNEGLADIDDGKVHLAKETFARFREERFDESL